MNCKNCGHEVNGNYCHHCGQATKVNRINFSNVLEDITEGVFQLNKGFFYTLKAMSVRPGHAIREFLEGKRKRHFKPIAYVVTMSTLYFLLSQVIDKPTWIDDGVTGFFNFEMTEKEKSASKILNVLDWFKKNYTYITLILLPIFSLASYLLFRRFKLNFLEHIVVNAYITGHQALFYAFFAILATTFGNHDILELLPLLIAVSYNFWTFNQLFSNRKWFVNLLRMTVTYVLYFIFSVTILLAIFGISEL
ncbi:MAG: DUF3667 domain-containing protein [Bacteroidota bacterium]